MKYLLEEQYFKIFIFSLLTKVKYYYTIRI
uniref:Uncharacterized protein n=1 Tax=Siphoviridae sp. ctHip2 TaxID=2827830 RepID=A0A8S5RVI9_9CAUD|nr:MAG TPA: hypothetical protein [Siphoviridae sp. ctHip2]